MSRWIPAWAIFLGSACAAWAAQPAPLTNLHAIHALTNEEASQGLPVSFEATVNYLRTSDGWLFVQDGGIAIFVWPPADLRLSPGDRVLIQGISHESYHPLIVNATVGTVYAAVDSRAKTRAIETEALSMATGLTAIAIESPRLYSDLVQRSEFDLLTEIHNRFSLDKQLDAMIAQKLQDAGIFGLIYIDLDEFKQVNDLYGHHVGDLYLQEVTLRMKRQLRTGDLLARLGGDEFAALLGSVRSRADIEEIALRLGRSFDEPFPVEGYVLQGTASVGIAIYPEDGSAKESLLRAADASMYTAKYARRKMTQR
jgi:diguanylate cyclase (GGDEF)-like protein